MVFSKGCHAEVLQWSASRRCQVMRDELLNETMFRDMAHARSAIRAWAADYNEQRPHSALGCQTPKAFAEHLLTATDSRAASHENSAHLSVAPPAPIGVSTQRAPVPAG
ncbi:transposase [Rhodobacteraceae bacterium 2CG4]|uniref:Transposase n=1 Tax=Halovulum marinum TaxID=2662447 RepID=A0A6L5YZ93_9RHOB|nr:transposase [Halovulum marinum]